MKIKDLIEKLSDMDPEREIRRINGSFFEETSIEIFLYGVDDKGKVEEPNGDETDVAVLVGA